MGNFPDICLLPISSLILLWSEDILCMICILLNLTKFVLWPRVQSALLNVPFALEEMLIPMLDGVSCNGVALSWQTG